ncbi:uncharacterized protein LOC130654828 [Hydractinia symbiolongicarpus]|uniref:uncharacterized protein LOC130654828 n=1 Tax=Hydractinia symbiolongicarpus TaxID=13093 RepID=UPI00254B1E66|nr:uncharacterized protein LOC130654828 [Hydractinia symbiolongicarpus]XP_057313454.1 uncharacterized protein LOC130654828 [Hydractinia symbiolongicarpus]
MGIVSKKYLETIIEKVQKATQVNQWRNTSTVIEWFKKTPTDTKSKFIKFDIVEFYLSISEELLDKAINFARAAVPIDNKVVDIIRHSRKSLLFDKSSTWVKKGNVLFDVTMGSFDGAEICELVGLYILKKISKIIDIKHVGLYRDDGLAIIQNANGPRMNKIRKDIITLFKEDKLSVTIETNLIETDFLDVSFNVNSKTYKPYRKPNNDPLYININSNHPNTVLKVIPTMVNERLIATSCNKKAFDDAKPLYEASLSASGFESTMTYANKPKQRPNRQRKIIWFNPPFSKNVKTDIGRSFLKIVRKNFSKDHKYYKIFNKNTLKLSYSCSTNIRNIIKGHNKKVLTSEERQKQQPCNCRDKSQCPLNGDCLATCIIYKAEVKYVDKEEFYYGLCEGEFKERFNNHKKSFRHEKYRNETELSKLIWRLKDDGTDFKISWSIEKRATSSIYICYFVGVIFGFLDFVLLYIDSKSWKNIIFDMELQQL